MPRVMTPGGGQGRDALNRELARLPREVTTAITWRMQQLGKSKADLARLLGVSPGRVSQILSGDENITLRTLASVCLALDARLDVKLVPAEVKAAPGQGDPPHGDPVYPDPSFGSGPAAFSSLSGR